MVLDYSSYKDYRTARTLYLAFKYAYQVTLPSDHGSGFLVY